MRIHIRDNLCTVYKLNLHRIQRYLLANGHAAVSTPEEADIIIAGVCAAFDADEQRSHRMLLDLAGHARPLFVIGCLATVRPELIPSAATAVFASWQYRQLADALAPHPLVAWRDVECPGEFRCRADYRIPDPTRRFVMVSLGCAFDCSYCPHKLGAGESESRPIDEILAQIQRLLDDGTKSIVLTGVDTASYGLDNGSSFATLLERILALPNNSARYHIAQFNPEALNSVRQREQMVQCCSDERVVDLQLPIQTTSDRLLSLMRRNYNVTQIAEFVADVRSHNPGLFMRTDLLVGFPTEMEEELIRTVEFTARHFNEAAVYGFELKTGTPIASSSLGFWDRDTIAQRTAWASSVLRDAGLLVHSGGQEIESLELSDLAKHGMRRSETEILAE